jgi:hypothetical protein
MRQHPQTLLGVSGHDLNNIAVGLILRSRKASVLATAHPISPESIDDPDDAGQKAERFARFELIT